MESAADAGLLAWLPLFLVSERRRRLASPASASATRWRRCWRAALSDRAILLGKVAAAVGYGWGITVLMILVGVVTVNVAEGGGQFLLYPAPIGLSMLVLSFLASALVANAGVLVSLRASTVRQAAQSLSLGIMALLFVPMFGVQLLPAELKGNLGQLLQGADLTTIVLGVLAVLIVLDASLLLAAKHRFQRSRLILD